MNFSIYIFLLCFPYIFLYHPILTVYFHELSITKRISIFLIESNLLFPTNGYYFCHVHCHSWSQLKYVHYCAKVRNYLSLWTNEFFVGVREMYTYVANETVCRIVMDLHMICIYSNVQRFIFIALTSRFHATFSIAFEIVSSYVHAIPIASVYPISLNARYLHRSAFKFKPMFRNFYSNLYILEYWHDNLIYIIRHKCLWIFDILHDWIPENRSWKGSGKNT